MSKQYIAAELRRRVEDRADGKCEYCLIPMLYGLITPYHIDHIVSEKHGGQATLENLAFACQVCNLRKGSDISTYLNNARVLLPLYHPRRDKWASHFALSETGELIPKTEVARGTINLLRLNDRRHTALRALLLREDLLIT